ncbi:MAG: hypothetical protein HKN26_02025 [Acidimicrobiales bacterium]|nr:hypothetical protein [Acidimicrobiales bacterium]
MTNDRSNEYHHDEWTGSALPPLPADFEAKRDDAHRLAYAVVAEARHAKAERFGLRYLAGGFGTPVFGDNERVRVAEGELIHEADGAERRSPITTLRAAAQFVGIEPGTTGAEHDSPELGDVDVELRVDAELTGFLDAWYGLAVESLRRIGADPLAAEVSPIQLWPGHFDPALEIGDQDAGQRATYGASPGDAAHPEPYLYVGAWADVDRSDPFWNESAFTGASLSFAELCLADDPREAAFAFYRSALHKLTG